ncbi:MAG: VOC family protein [Gemmatimonadaceae bacterium]|nr:VOC family protein [Gemmatimonadaceae bacterium]
MRIRDIRHVGLLSPAVAAHAGYHVEALGLHPAGEDRHARYLQAASSEHHALSLHPADRTGLHHLAFRLDGPAAVDAAATELEGRGVPLAAQPDAQDEPGGGYGLRFLDPENRCIELSAGVAEHPSRGSTGRAGPRRLCHVGLNTASFEQIVEFYTGVLGFRVSDRIEDQMAFLRCGRRHHAIVFSRADHPSVNHVAYAMASVDDVMKGVSGLRARGQEPGWGPGRHGPGHNIFCYYEDPAGYVVELSSDLEEIEDEAAHEPAVWRRVPETADLWGTAGPPGAEIRKAMAGDPDPGWAANGGRAARC